MEKKVYAVYDDGEFLKVFSSARKARYYREFLTHRLGYNPGLLTIVSYVLE